MSLLMSPIVSAHSLSAPSLSASHSIELISYAQRLLTDKKKPSFFKKSPTQEPQETSKKKIGWEIIERLTSSIALSHYPKRIETIDTTAFKVLDLSTIDEYRFIVHTTDPESLDEALQENNFLSKNAMFCASLIDKQTPYWISGKLPLALLLAIDPRAIFKTASCDISSPCDEEKRLQFIDSEKAFTQKANQQEAAQAWQGDIPSPPSFLWEKLKENKTIVPYGSSNAPYGINPLHTVEGILRHNDPTESQHNEILLLGNGKISTSVRATQICGFVLEKALFDDYKQKISQGLSLDTLNPWKTIQKSNLPLLLIKTEHPTPQRLIHSISWMEGKLEKELNQSTQNLTTIGQLEGSISNVSVIARQYFTQDEIARVLERSKLK